MFSRHKCICMRHFDSYCARVGSLNVGTLMGKEKGVGGYGGKVGVLCVYETRWKGNTVK